MATKKKPSKKEQAKAQVKKLLSEGLFVHAIKVYYQTMGCGLAEAANYVREERSKLQKKKYGF